MLSHGRFARKKPAWIPSHRPAASFRELVTRHPVARRLPLEFSATRLVDDLARIEEGWWTRHLGPYHTGGWESVSLWAPRGDMREQRSFGGAFAATEALRATMYFDEVLESFPGQRNRVRLMRLRVGARILRHSDPLHLISRDLTRIHIPIVTSSGVSFVVNGRAIPMRAGEAWHIDVRFPHEVRNESDHDRVHLVVDVLRGAALDELLAASMPWGHGFLVGYFIRNSLPPGWKRRLKIGT